jgi:hypothetical protein
MSNRNGTGSWKSIWPNCGCSGFSRKFRSSDVKEGTDSTAEFARRSHSSPSCRVVYCSLTTSVAQCSGNSLSVKISGETSSGKSLSQSRTCRGVHRTNAPESREPLMNGFHSCKPRGRLSNSSGRRPVLNPRHHTVDMMRGKAVKHASAQDAVFDSHQDIFHFLIALVGLSGLKWSLALKGRVRRPEPMDRFLLVRENFARMH